MKPFPSILLAASLWGTKGVLAAPAAILTKVSGEIEVVRGAQKLKGRDGLALQNGDRVVVKKGAATVFSLSRAPQTLKSGTLVVGGAASATKQSPLWKDVYNGLSVGLSPRNRRIAATMRPGEIVPLAPVQSLIEEARPRFEWRPGSLDAKRYAVVVLNAQKAIIWRGETEKTSLQYPPTAPPLQGALSWQVSPLRQEKGQWQPIEGWASRATPFQIATAAQISAVRAKLAALNAQQAGAVAADRALSRAALWNAAGFKAAALRELQNAGEAPTVQSFRETLWLETGQSWRLPSTQTTKPASIGGADPSILAFTPDSPLLLTECKNYVAPDGTFSLQVPQRFSVVNLSLPPGVDYTEFGIDVQGGARMGLAIAPANDYAAPGALLEFFKAVIAKVPTGANFRADTPQDTVFRSQKAILSRWSDIQKSGVPTSGGWLEWSEGGKKIAVFWGAPQAIGADALRPLLDTFKLAPTPATSTPVSPHFVTEMLASVDADLAAMDKAEERQHNRLFGSPPSEVAPTAADFEALDQKQRALPANSHERAEVALEASRLASRLGWQATDQGDTKTAEQYFERRAQLESESYRAEVAALDADIGQTEAKIARWSNLTLPQNQSRTYVDTSDSLRIIEGIQLSARRNLALNAGDTAALAEKSRQLFELRRIELESARISNETPQNLWQRQIAIASALENLGDVSQAQADLYAGRAYFTRALEWRRAVPSEYSRRNSYESLRKRAVLENRLGDIRLARDFYEQTLAEFEKIAPARQKEIEAETNPQIKEYRRIEWVQLQAVMLNNLGAVTQNLGDYTTAENYFQKALKTIEILPTEGASGSLRATTRAATLTNLGVLRSDTGELEKGAALLGEAAEIYRTQGNDSGVALNLFNSATSDYNRSAYAAANTKLGIARQIFAQLQNSTDLVDTDVLSAKVAVGMGEMERALQLGQSAVDLARPLNNPGALVASVRNLADLRLQALGEKPLTPTLRGELEALIKEAQEADTRSGSAQTEINTLFLRTNFLIKVGDLEGALTSIRAAIARLERMRTTTASRDVFSNQESVSVYYDTAVWLLLKLKRPEEAFDMMSRARSKKLRDTLRLVALKSNDLVLQKLLDRSASLNEQLAKTRAQLASEQSLPAPERDTTKLKNLRELIASTQQEFFDVSAQIKARNPRFEKALALSPRELKKAQRAIPTGALLLQYAVLDDGLYIFAVTRDSLQIFQPKVSKKELNSTIRAYRSAIDADIAHLTKGQPTASIDSPSPLRSVSEQLSGWLLAPVQSQIDAAKTVAVIPSGELFYLPFHALGEADKNGKWRFLIEDKPVAYLAVGDVLAVAQERDIDTEGRGVLAMGDPTGADLPAAKLEVESIARLFPDSRALTGAGASKANLLLPSSRDKRVLHLAAHGVLDAARPDQSFIQLSPSEKDDGKLHVGEIYGLDLNRVDLVTLSACRTALGEGEPDGTEISSLAESFSSAGTPSVVASLWNVEDQSTARLMEKFYGALADGTPKGVALQKAQVALLRDPKTRHPVFWAPFELLGDWR